MSLEQVYQGPTCNGWWWRWW